MLGITLVWQSRYCLIRGCYELTGCEKCQGRTRTFLLNKNKLIILESVVGFGVGFHEGINRIGSWEHTYACNDISIKGAESHSRKI